MSGLRQSLRRAYATAVLAYAGGGFQRGSHEKTVIWLEDLGSGTSKINTETDQFWSSLTEVMDLNKKEKPSISHS